MKTQDALYEYIKESEKRVIIDRVFCARMSKEIAEKFDAGQYDVQIAEHKKCINELTKMQIKYPENTKPVFYLYIVPDENFVELLRYPYTDRKCGGRPVDSYDEDGFNAAYGSSQNLLASDKLVNMNQHVNNIHEYAHLIQGQFGYRDQMFGEGFAELVPWYVMEYDKKSSLHIAAMRSMDKIYTANELLSNVKFSDRVQNMTCSFQPSYMSSYLWVRAVVEHIRSKFNLSRVSATQKFLELYHNIKFGKQLFVKELAKEIGMDADKLLNSAEYQIAALKQIEAERVLKDVNLKGKEK